MWWFKTSEIQTSLVVWWLRLCASTAEGMDLIPGWGTKISHVWQKKNKTAEIYSLTVLRGRSLKVWQGHHPYSVQGRIFSDFSQFEGAPGVPWFVAV